MKLSPAISELSRNGVHGRLCVLPLLPTSEVSICAESVVLGGSQALQVQILPLEICKALVKLSLKRLAYHTEDKACAPALLS